MVGDTAHREKGDTMYTTISKAGEYSIRADWQGGPYIELTFGTLAYRPTEVINVWDYQAGKAELDIGAHSEDFVKAWVREQVRNWITSNVEEGWDDWYAGYLENAR